MNRFSLDTNPGAEHSTAYGGEQSKVLDEKSMHAAFAEITSWPGYLPTPLHAMLGLAAETGVGAVYYKDESERFGLGSFKPIGGAYAVYRAIARAVAETGAPLPTSEDLLRGAHREETAKITVCAASDGNHGRAVAWGAKTFGCRCVIYLNEAVTGGREQAIAAFGAQVVRNPGSYDDAVRAVAARAGREGWHLIPDTSDGSVISQPPLDVMHGYTLMAEEAIQQLPEGKPPTHMFLQAGVGGMAAATCARFWLLFGPRRPLTITVEPRQCACWFASLAARRPVTVKGEIDSVMAGLSCGEVSHLAWPILRTGADAMMRIDDEVVPAAMRLLAQAPYGDQPVVGGESGVAGLAGFLAAAGDRQAREKLGLNAESRVLLFGSEGDTDPLTYSGYVGQTGAEVRQSAINFRGELS